MRPSTHVLAAAFALLAPVLTAPGQAPAQSPAAPPSAEARAPADPPRPRLVVVISVDQLRADHLARFADLFKPAGTPGAPGGFRFLMTHGAYFPAARYEHFPLFTASGHAVIMTGGHPYKTGVIGNEWWDPTVPRYVYSADDPRGEIVGLPEGRSSTRAVGPANLRSTTVGDELKLASGDPKRPDAPRVVAIAFKDRPAVFMGGHSADVCLWFDAADALWLSSAVYCPGKELPAWVAALNEERLPDRSLGTTWAATQPPQVLAARTRRPPVFGKRLPPEFGEAFPHAITLGKGADRYRGFTLTPDANAFVFATAERAIEAEGLGRDETPDILALNLSTNDYVGHLFGPYSPEMLEITLATDAQLADFLAFLRDHVPGGLANVAVALIADHGVAPVPEDAAASNLPAGRFKVTDVLDRIADALTARYGPPPGGTWYSVTERGVAGAGRSGAFLEGSIYLNANALESLLRPGDAGAQPKARSRREVEETACDAVNGARIPGVYAAYGRTQILEGRLPRNDLADRLEKGVHPQLSGDLLVIHEGLFLEDPTPEGHATTHGSPYVYDTSVPILLYAPAFVRPGIYHERAAPSDIAPTLSYLLRVSPPSACDGHTLTPALRR